MSVYIDMEMPKSCDMCWASDDYGDYPRCRITEEQRGYNFPIREKRMDNCPLTPVPPHGRLIDADKMRESIRKQTAFLRILGGEFAEIAETLEKGFLQEIDNAPTIISAEEGET